MELIKINKQDKIIGKIDKITAHKKGILHRAFSVFVVKPVVADFSPRQIHRRMNSANTKGHQILLQKRSKQKKLWPGSWSNTTCSHPEPNQDIKQSAEQRLKQEMGFTLPLKKAGKIYYKAQYKNIGWEHEITHVFLGKYTDQPINPNPKEVADYKWISINDLKKSIADSQLDYTPWLKKIINYRRLKSAITNL